MNISFSCFLEIATLLLISTAVAGGKDPEAFSIEASQGGLFVSGYAWKIHVHADGNARLTIISDKETVRDLKVSAEHLSQFKKCLAAEKFFELPETVGKAAPDVGVRKLLVRQGSKERSVAIEYLHKDVLNAEERPVARRASRVWASLRGMFDDKEAFDIRPYEGDIRK